MGVKQAKTKLSSESVEAIKNEIYGYLLDLGLCDDKALEIIELITNAK